MPSGSIHLTNFALAMAADMKRLIIISALLFCVSTLHAKWIYLPSQNPPKIDNNLETKTKLTPCVKALLNQTPLNSGSNVSKSAQGTITVENTESEKIFFNLTLKTNIGKKGEPPVYLRFIKVSQLDIRKVLEYAKSGDEIYIEQYSIDPNIRLICAPSSLIVT